MDPSKNPEQWVHDHGDVMYRYALKHVRNEHVAQDLVQEALLAAWRGRDNFDGRSQVRTWLIGILRHKVLDHYRRRKRESPASDPQQFDAWVDDDDVFTDSGMWRIRPSSWGENPEAALENEAFMQAFETCLERLPEQMADAFILRNVEHIETDEACKALDVTPTNLYVLLYRARAKLRQCLENTWFNEQK